MAVDVADGILKAPRSAASDPPSKIITVSPSESSLYADGQQAGSEAEQLKVISEYVGFTSLHSVHFEPSLGIVMSRLFLLMKSS